MIARESENSHMVHVGCRAGVADDEPTGGSAQTRKEISHLSREAAKVKVIRDAIRSEDK
jgi:hypothetical protein